MNLRKQVGRGREYGELNIIPVMNVFVVLIPFLLLTAVFVRIAVIEMSLPTVGGEKGEQLPNQEIVITIIAIEEEGFRIKSSQAKYPPIKKRDGEYDYDALASTLRRIKGRNPHLEDIIISPDPNIKYEIIIKVMDQCRENGFPNISISG